MTACIHNCVLLFFHAALATAKPKWEKHTENWNNNNHETKWICARNVANTIGHAIATLPYHDRIVFSYLFVRTVSTTNKQYNSHCIHIHIAVCHTERYCVLSHSFHCLALFPFLSFTPFYRHDYGIWTLRKVEKNRNEFTILWVASLHVYCFFFFNFFVIFFFFSCTHGVVNFFRCERSMGKIYNALCQTTMYCKMQWGRVRVLNFKEERMRARHGVNRKDNHFGCKFSFIGMPLSGKEAAKYKPCFSHNMLPASIVIVDGTRKNNISTLEQ